MLELGVIIQGVVRKNVREIFRGFHHNILVPRLCYLQIPVTKLSISSSTVLLMIQSIIEMFRVKRIEI